MPEFEPESDPQSEPTDPSETLYPTSPKGDVYEVAPKPLSSDLRAALDEINRQDVGAK